MQEPLLHNRQETPLTSHSKLNRFRLGRSEDLTAFVESTTRAVRGVRTGLPNFDSQVRGLQGIVGILGGPKSCKSTFALQIAIHNASVGVPVLFVDRENGLMHMRERAICNYHNTPWSDFCKRGEVAKRTAFKELNQMPLYIVNEPFNESILAEWVEELVASAPNEALLVIDSLHKLPMNMEDMRISVDRWLLFLDSLKLKYNRKLTIIVTCEKTRGKYDNAFKDGAKESGRIEYTLEQQLDMRETAGQITLDCTYNRHGPTFDGILFEKILTRAGDKWSFIFKLREGEEGVDV